MFDMSGCGNQNDKAQDMSEVIVNENNESVIETKENMVKTDSSNEIRSEEIIKDESEIVNNNGRFVQIDDKVYFHLAEPESMNRTQRQINFIY